MNELRHILRCLNNDKTVRLYKAAVALMLALLLALTPGLAFATAGDEPAQESADVVSEMTEGTEDTAADFEGKPDSACQSKVISPASVEDPNAPDEGDENSDPNPEAELRSDLRGMFNAYLQDKGIINIIAKTPYERALLAHDFLVERSDFTFNPDSTSTGVFGFMAGDCSSKSFHDAFVCLLGHAGIGGDDMVQEVSVRENNRSWTWTLVKLDGKWTHIDTALDKALFQPEPGQVGDLKHLCFGLTDYEIKLVHPSYTSQSEYPALTNDNNYYHVSHNPENLVGLGSVKQAITEIGIQEGKLAKGEPFSVDLPIFVNPTTATGKDFTALIYNQIANCLDGDKFGSYTVSVAYTTNKYSVNAKNLINNAFMSISSQNFTGSPLPAKLLFNKPVIQDKDYTVMYKRATAPDSNYIKDAPWQAGDYKVKITGIINYQGEIVVDYKINQADISKVTPDEGNGWRNVIPYNGKPITQSTATLKFGNYTLRANDYEVVGHSNNNGPGQAGMTIRGKGNFTTGPVTFSFTITGTPSASNPSNASSGNNGATNVTTQAAPTAKTVSGTWKKSGGKWWFSYDAKTTKAEHKSWPANEWVIIKGKRYHFDSRGYMNTKWFSYGGKWYWFGSDGAMKTGWQKASGKWYYMASDGVMQTGKKNLSDGKTYYLNPSSGAMKTGWNKEGSTWYYYNSSGAMVAKNWVKSSGKWYYFGNNGAMQTNKQTIGSQTYNFASSGAMITGWNKENGTYYHYGSSGAMTKGWVKSGGKWYFMDRSTGAMWTKQLEKIDGKTYAFHPSTGEMLVGWFKLTHPTTKVSNMYYFKSSGVMAAGEWIGNYYLESDGRMARDKWIGKYHVNANGYWDVTAK